MLATPPPAVVLGLPDRNERLTAGTARSFRDGLATTGGISALAMMLPVLPVGRRMTASAPRVVTVPRGSPDRKLINRLNLSAQAGALLRHPADDVPDAAAQIGSHGRSGHSLDNTCHGEPSNE